MKRQPSLATYLWLRLVYLQSIISAWDVSVFKCCLLLTGAGTRRLTEPMSLACGGRKAALALKGTPIGLWRTLTVCKVVFRKGSMTTLSTERWGHVTRLANNSIVSRRGPAIIHLSQCDVLRYTTKEFNFTASFSTR